MFNRKIKNQLQFYKTLASDYRELILFNGKIRFKQEKVIQDYEKQFVNLHDVLLNIQGMIEGGYIKDDENAEQACIKMVLLLANITDEVNLGLEIINGSREEKS